MKCIQNTANNEVMRVSNEIAKKQVKRGWTYVQKSLWKADPTTKHAPAKVPANPMSNKKVANKAARYMTPPKANSRRSRGIK